MSSPSSWPEENIQIQTKQSSIRPNPQAPGRTIRVVEDEQALDCTDPSPHSCRAWRDAPVPLVRVGAGHGEPVEAGRRAVARLLDPLLLRHPRGDGPRVPNLLDTDLVRAEAAVPGVAGAAQLQGSGLHLRQVRQGPAQEARPHQPPRQRQEQEGERRQGEVAVAVPQGEGERQEQVPLLRHSQEGSRSALRKIGSLQAAAGL